MRRNSERSSTSMVTASSRKTATKASTIGPRGHQGLDVVTGISWRAAPRAAERRRRHDEGHDQTYFLARTLVT